MAIKRFERKQNDSSFFIVHIPGREQDYTLDQDQISRDVRIRHNGGYTQNYDLNNIHQIVFNTSNGASFHRRAMNAKKMEFYLSIYNHGTNYITNRITSYPTFLRVTSRTTTYNTFLNVTQWNTSRSTSITTLGSTSWATSRNTIATTSYATSILTNKVWTTSRTTAQTYETQGQLYIDSYSDLVKVWLNNWQYKGITKGTAGWDHYNTYGKNEGRINPASFTKTTSWSISGNKTTSWTTSHSTNKTTVWNTSQNTYKTTTWNSFWTTSRNTYRSTSKVINFNTYITTSHVTNYPTVYTTSYFPNDDDRFKN